jgi:hypothetical protein
VRCGGGCDGVVVVCGESAVQAGEARTIEVAGYANEGLTTVDQQTRLCGANERRQQGRTDPVSSPRKEVLSRFAGVVASGYRPTLSGLKSR